MKRNLLFFAAAVATISILASCAKEMEETTPNKESEETTTVPSGEMVTITFKADYPNPVMEGTVAPQQAEADTRTTIAEDGTVAWEIADEITLYYMEGETVASAPATALTAGVKADFQVTIPEGVEEVFAVYPAGKGELTPDGVFKVKTGGAQNGSFEQANYAAAWAVVSDEMNLSFKNVVGLFRVRLPEGGIIEDGDVNHTIKSISIAGKKSEPAFLGDVTVTVGDDGALAFSAPENAATETVVELDEETRNAGYAYIPSLPVTSADGLVFRFMNTEGIYLPAAVTKDDKAITLDRGHLKPVNTACESVIFDWYFAQDGQGDGKSASSPAGVAEFQKLLNDSQYTYGQWRLDGATLNLADGNYALTETLNIKGEETGTITIKGQSQAGTVIDGGKSLQLINWTSAMNLTIKDLTLTKGKATVKGVCLAGETATGLLTMENCTSSYNTTTANGNIYLKTKAKFVNCTFDNNSAVTGGGICIGGSADADVEIDRCTFTYNSASYQDGGSAILTTSPSAKLYINRSVFAHNSLTPTYYGAMGVAISSTSGGKVGVFNCTFNDNTATAMNAYSFSAKKYILVNSTFVEASTGRVTTGVVGNLATEDATSTVVNNIILHNSSNADHTALGGNNHLDSGYNILKLIHSNLSVASNEPTNYSSADLTKTAIGFNNLENGTYTWTGDISAFTGFSRCNLEYIEGKIKYNTQLGEDFWNWLKSIKVGSYDATQVDMRGVLRDSDAMWPGSYQDILQQSTESTEEPVE